MNKVMNFFRSEEGLELPEYAVAGALIVIAIVAAYQGLKNAVSNSLSDMSSSINTR